MASVMLNFRLAPFMENARANFWFVPTLMITSSVAMFILTVWIDIKAIGGINQYLPILYASDPNAVRALLGIIAGSMITVTSIAFSITIVSLTMASSQFGPRLMRNFMMDPVTQIVLGIFTSNFVFCILVFCVLSLKAPYEFSPGISLLWALIMTLVSVGFLIHFIHHVAKSIQADAVVDDVYKELEGSIDTFFPPYTDDYKWRPQESTRLLNDEGYEVHYELRATASGYVQLIDTNALVKLLSKHDLRLRLDYSAGNYVHKESVFAHVYTKNDTCPLDAHDIEKHFVLGAKRTPIQDPEFAVHQLVEIALRALSPGINDPYTAMVCVDKLGSILCDLSSRQFPSVEKQDENGELRLHCKRLCFKDMGCAAFDQIRQHARDNVSITIRLLVSLKQIAIQAKTQQQYEFIEQQSAMIKQQQSSVYVSEFDAQDIDKYLDDIQAYLTKTPAV